MSGIWRIEMLGGLRAVRGDRPVLRFPTRKTALLLAYLALHPGRFHPREALAEMLWPDVPRDAQLHNLRLTLSRLRGLFEPDAVLQTDRLTIRLDPATFTTDVREFEQAIARNDAPAATALYSGPLLPGLYEEWILLHQARLEALRDQLQNPAEDHQESLLPPQRVLDDKDRLAPRLPRPLTRFFGRDAELESLRTLLTESHLLTLTGPGGAGKTRLSLEAARAQQGSGAVFVSLADLTYPAQVTGAIGRALRLPAPAPGFSLTELVHRELVALSPLLLILDNAEHLLKGRILAEYVSDTLAAVPYLTVLVASRRALDIPGEVLFPVGPLPMEVRVALFLDRARTARPGFGETSQTLPTVREICRRLEGIPLALELAAARASVLSVQEILENITRRLDFLSSRQETTGVPRRHRSLRAAIRSSFDLLPPALQEQFARLSVFRGGFTAAAAHAVAGARHDSLDELLRWSLLLSEEQPDGSLRFRMLETLRDFGQECLTDEEHKALSRQHARYLCEWTETNRADAPTSPLPDYITRLARQDAEQDNVRAALAFCRKSKDVEDRETGLRMVCAFWAFWYARNSGQEMASWVAGLLDSVADTISPLIRARALLAMGLGVREQGQIAQFIALVEEALTVLTEGPPDRYLAFALHLRGLACADQQRFADAAVAYAAAQDRWDQLGDRRNAATTRHNRALLAVEQGDQPLAERLCGEALTVFREWNEQSWVAIGLLTWAGTCAGRGDLEAAIAACQESVAAYREVGYARGEAQAEQALCRYLNAQGYPDEAADHALCALSLFRRVGDRHGEATALLHHAEVYLRRLRSSDDLANASECIAEASRLQAQHQWPSVAPLLNQVEQELRRVTAAP